jgi:DNA-binding HxlR family transcriptional regulator
MRWKQIDTMTCSIARTLAVVGDRWTMLIIRDVFLGIRRFEAIQQDLQLTTHRLSDRLHKLVRDGIPRRVAYEKRPPRFEYRLTEKGVDLYPLIVAMIEWGDRWMARAPACRWNWSIVPAGTRLSRNSSAPTANQRSRRVI